MTAPPYLTILGGGPAGLAAAYFARERGWSARLLEASGRVGGNCITLERGGYRFDSGAHRFHDKDPEMTAVVRRLLGDELKLVSAPSAICLGGRFLTFPPSVRGLTEFLGPRRAAAAAVGVVRQRLTPRRAPDSLESFAVRAYGPALARLFLLNYSQKLWGVPCARLSVRASGGRLRGLSVSALMERGRGQGGHLEGAFYYPAGGYGRIATRLAEACGPGVIRTGARATRLRQDGARITHVEVDGQECLPVDQVVSTLPLGLAAKLFDPALPDEVRAHAEEVKFRHLLLAVLFLDRASVSGLATAYFPDPAVPFTRVSEPRNRSAALSPPGRTSLVVEIPCGPDEEIWSAADGAIVGSVKPALAALGWIGEDHLLDACVVRVPNAYPILTMEAERAAAAIGAHLGRFSNLHLAGRNGLFDYGWLHTALRSAKSIVDRLPPRAP